MRVERSVPFFCPTRTIRLFGGWVSRRVHLHALSGASITIGAVVLLALADLSLGAYPTPISTVLEVLAGGGDHHARLAVAEWRLPRVLAALLFGAALGMSGAIFQSLARNPLGSPDIIGIDAGAFNGILFVILFAGYTPTGIAAGAFVGGTTAALTAYLLARGSSGLRFVLTGVGIAMPLTAFNTWMLSTSRLEVATAAATWGAGSLDNLERGEIIPIAGLLLGLMLCAVCLQRRLHSLNLGDDIARAHGVKVDRLRTVLLLLGAALTICVTALAGPIGFVALAAPQLARLATRAGDLSLATAAIMGCALLVAADIISIHLFAPTRLPVGLVTLVGGGAYLIALLSLQLRSTNTRHQ